ncbi:CMGC/CK2 protein kinase [Thecamonas trahens ATCC 50062]|uniref:CMGC/CK2 protein kinase n=1 Tax=Thecamonas trahens ATCC 50062 TaxID=461836 RepID=A0A0L0D8I7_THETB|nr:CMGC/CK2 protein kinase [Thecamonas trahens ATCC 50062]KNC47593.1 CMGC/CK2 protein kinase [Thecamonas trahens ATCC 50062]|eukprot:XP_013759522.1 CMGC/CK2 protein kinase [Thecamonas trahens ATCC 50062]
MPTPTAAGSAAAAFGSGGALSGRRSGSGMYGGGGSSSARGSGGCRVCRTGMPAYRCSLCRGMVLCEMCFSSGAHPPSHPVVAFQPGSSEPSPSSMMRGGMRSAFGSSSSPYSSGPGPYSAYFGGGGPSGGNGGGYYGMGSSVSSSHGRAVSSIPRSELGFSVAPDSDAALALGRYLVVSAPPYASPFADMMSRKEAEVLAQAAPGLLPETVLDHALLLEMGGSLASAHPKHPFARVGSADNWSVAALEVREQMRDVLWSAFRIGSGAPGAADPVAWSLRADEELVELASAQARRWGVPTAALDAAALELSAEETAQLPALSGISSEVLRARFVLVRLFNQVGAAVIPSRRGSRDEPAEWNVLAACVSEVDAPQVVDYLRGVIFAEIKLALLVRTMGAAAPATYLRVNVNRAKARVVARDGLNSIFGQLFSQLRHLDYSALRGGKNDNMFQIGFLGEGSMDGGGPYREALMLACADLMSDVTPLFELSPNGVNGVGINRDRYVVNSGATSDLQLAMFEFAGALLGMGLRTNVNMPVALAPTVWKRMLGARVDVADLEAQDRMLVNSLREMVAMKRDVFEEWLDERFVAVLASGEEVELVPGGREEQVTYERRVEFARLQVEAHLATGASQIRALRRGLGAVVPLSSLSLCTGADLEYLVCGAPDVNLETLKRHTVFNGQCRESTTVEYLWEVLSEFSPAERQLFLRFVWGRNRLPLRDTDWNQQFMITVETSKAPDGFPRANTCNFSIYLPQYSCKEVLEQRLRFAIVNCQAIDTDYNTTATQASLWVDYADDDNPADDTATAAALAAPPAVAHARAAPATSALSSPHSAIRLSPAVTSALSASFSSTAGSSPPRFASGSPEEATAEAAAALAAANEVMDLVDESDSRGSSVMGLSAFSDISDDVESQFALPSSSSSDSSVEFTDPGELDASSVASGVASGSHSDSAGSASSASSSSVVVLSGSTTDFLASVNETDSVEEQVAKFAQALLKRSSS